MIKRMIVKSDGFNLIGRIKSKMPHNYRTRGVRSWKSKKFDEYYYEAQYNGISENDLPDYIQQRFWDEADDIINDTIDDEEFQILYDNFQNRLHKRFIRYRDKLLMNDWNYFVTFTYDNDKETAEGFEKRLIIAFNNLAKRNGWKVVGGWENGELNGRSHFHAFIYVPEGCMVGELESRSRYSYKRHRMEFYVDNTYFSERFGMSDWIAITRNDIMDGGLVGYLVKYVLKSGRRLFYSRRIPNEIEMDVDTETDVILSYKDYDYDGCIVKYVLSQTEAFAQSLFNLSIDFNVAVNLDGSFCGFCDDVNKVLIVNT